MSQSHSNTDSGVVDELAATKETAGLKDSPDKEAAPAPAGDVFPEGGRDAWLTVAGGLLCAPGAIQSFGVYQDYYTRIFLSEHPASDISWIGSVQIFFLFSVGIISGRLFDQGYFRQLLAGGSTLYLVSSFLLSLARPHHYYQNFLAQAIGMGIGMGIIFLPSLSIVAHYFKRRRAVAIGAVLSGSSIGAVIYPLMINRLFASKGFAWGVRAVSFLDLGLLLIANLIMKTRLPPRPSAGNMRVILKDIPFWICLIGEAVTFWGLFVPIFYIQLYAVEHNASRTLQTNAVSILNAAGFFGRTLPMVFSDMWGPFPVILPLTFISGIMAFAFLGAKSDAGIIVFAILYGLFSGGFISLSVPTSASFSRNVGEIGSRVGMMSLVCSFTLLTGNPISGALLRNTWIQPIIFSGVTIFAGFVFLLVAGYLQRKQRNG
ncbi:MFS general substrate transporter [Mycena vitilis]|nr:MFS general substrate transporter [Mycena vitilis]